VEVAAAFDLTRAWPFIVDYSQARLCQCDPPPQV